MCSNKRNPSVNRPVFFFLSFNVLSSINLKNGGGNIFGVSKAFESIDKNGKEKLTTEWEKFTRREEKKRNFFFSKSSGFFSPVPIPYLDTEVRDERSLTVQGPATTKRDRPGQSNKATNDPYGISQRNKSTWIIIIFWGKQQKWFPMVMMIPPAEKKGRNPPRYIGKNCAIKTHRRADNHNTTRKPAVTLFVFSFSISFGLFWMKQPDLLSSLRAWNYPLHFGVFFSVFTRRTSWLKEKMVVGAISILPAVFFYTFLNVGWY